MSQTLQKTVPIAAITALTAQPTFFGGVLEWVQMINNSPNTVYVLGHGLEVMFPVWPGDVFPYDFGDQNFNTLNLYATAASTAADILLGNVLYIRYKLKRGE